MKQLTLIPIGGLANRFYAIVSSIALCEKYKLKLRIIWFKDHGMGASFHSLFKLSADAVDFVEVVDAQWYHYIYDRPRKRNLWLPGLFQKHKFDVKYYIPSLFEPQALIDSFKKFNSIYLVHCSYFYPEASLHYIEPQSAIIDQANHIVGEIFRNRVIGMHIRRTDNIESIRKSPLELFTNAIDHEIKMDPTVSFFVASDSLEEKQKLKDLYGDRVCTSMEQTTRATEKGIIDAFVELYILSKTNKIYGSSHSTFSMLAAQLSGIELEVLSLDS